MKKVKLLVSTAYQGPRKEGDVVSIPDDYANRWVKNGIAEFFEGNEASDKIEPVSQEDTVVDETPEKIEDYSQMSAKDLFALCKDKGLDVEAKKSKEYYIEKLQG